MTHFAVDNWFYMYFALVLVITCTQMVLVYVLSDSSNPPAGLGLYTVYFMASLLGWIAYLLQQAASTTVSLDVPAIAAMINSFILFLAAGQRAGMNRGRIVMGILCVGGALSSFFLGPANVLLVQGLLTALLFAGVGILSMWRTVRGRNVGDAVTAVAALVMVVGMPLLHLYNWSDPDVSQVQAQAFALHSLAYVLVIIGFLASVLLEYQGHLVRLSVQDPLTGLLNRRGLQEALHISVATASRQQQCMAAIAVDIDHFKQINDSFGHAVGDHVIQQVAAKLRKLARTSDVIARVGGDDFMYVLPNNALEAAKSLAERIRLTIGEQQMLVDQHRIPVTVSLGVASTQGDIDLDELCEQADRALYLAKQAGRDKVASLDSKPVRLKSSVQQP